MGKPERPRFTAISKLSTTTYTARVERAISTQDVKSHPSVARKIGIGPTLGVTIIVGGLALLATPLALVGAPAVILATTGFIEGLTIPVYNISQVSLRQAITPDRVQGRMNATMRTIVWGTIPLGAFIGGILGTSIGLVPTIVLGGILSTLAASWIFLGPVIRLREQPAPVMA